MVETFAWIWYILYIFCAHNYVYCVSETCVLGCNADGITVLLDGKGLHLGTYSISAGPRILHLVIRSLDLHIGEQTLSIWDSTRPGVIWS